MKLTAIVCLIAFLAATLVQVPHVQAAAADNKATSLAAAPNAPGQEKKDDVAAAKNDKPKKSKKDKDAKDGDPDDGNNGKGNDDKTLPNDGPAND
jgi:hypothetical protein